MSYQPSNAKSLTASQLIAAGAAADTAAATSLGVDVAEYEGTLTVVQNVGTVTAGSVAGKLVTSDASDLSGAVDVSGGTFTTVTTSTDPAVELVHVQASAVKKYLGYVGTIVTGPVGLGVTLLGAKQNAS